jgi:hypothetical protein
MRYISPQITSTSNATAAVQSVGKLIKLGNTVLDDPTFSPPVCSPAAYEADE